VVEPVFGQIKQARGFRQFLLRSVEKVRAEWAMICTTHNLLKLFNLANAASDRHSATNDGLQRLSGRAPSSTESENCLSTIERIGYLGRFRLW
jgi:hypothetical protein